jgi:hypothetical protein
MRRGRMKAAAVVVGGALALTGVTGLAVVADGIPVRSVAGVDSGVWVTRSAVGQFGRQNKTARALDAGFYADSAGQERYDLDVVQDGDTVVTYDRARGRLTPVDTQLGLPLPADVAQVAIGAIVKIGGGTLATLDPATGEIRALRYTADDPIVSLDALSAPPLATIGKGKSDSADLVVTQSGTILAVDHLGGRVAVPVDDSGEFAKPVVGRTTAVAHPRLGAVGDHVVLVDPDQRTVQIDDGAPARFDGADARPQQAGPDRSSALVATTTGLVSVSLSGGTPQSSFRQAVGAPTAPLVAGDCAYAAWAGSPATVVQGCGQNPPARLAAPDEPTLQPVFRANRGFIVLNDQDTGQIYDPTTERAVEDWTNLIPPRGRDANSQNPEQADLKAKPEPAPDTLEGVRPGEAASIHVLDNDADPSGGILSVTDVQPRQGTGWAATIAPDGQSVTVSTDAKARVPKLTYTVSNGRPKGTAKSTIVVRRVAKGNRVPRPAANLKPRVWSMAAGSSLVIPIVSDWRDDDGDPLAVTAPKVRGPGTALLTPDGAGVEVAAQPDSSGTLSVSMRVADDRGKSTSHTVQVSVVASDGQSTVAPTAVPDAVRAVTKGETTIAPLVNDIPGVDPRNPDAPLALQADVVAENREQAAAAGIDIKTDLATGLVRFTAASAGTYLLSYTAGIGSAAPAVGRIRVDVAEPPKDVQPPIATADVVMVHGQSPAFSDVLANDVDLGGALLSVQSVDVGGEPIQASIVGGRWLRVVPTGTRERSSTIRYVVTNGTKRATANLTVVMSPAMAQDLPITAPDKVTVRAGDSVRIAALENDRTPGGAPLTLLAAIDGAPKPGQLMVTNPAEPTSTDVGDAYVVGSSIQYNAPKAPPTGGRVVVDYVAQTPTGDRAGGRVLVEITPAPTKELENHNPSPSLVEARTNAGETITIPMPSWGQDPDGDSVVVAGLASPPTLGRVLGFSPNAVTYQAYPEGGRSGTDRFRIAVADRFGGVGLADVAVGVLDPQAPAPAVTIPDSLIAAPGAQVTLPLVENDLVARGDPVVVQPLTETNTALPAGVSLDKSGRTLLATAPADKALPLTISYGVAGLAGKSTLATATIRSVKGYQNPPRVYDVVAKGADPSRAEATVDLLERAYDPDGNSAKLSVTVADPTVKLSGSRATVTFSATPQAIPFVVSDEAGARSAGMLYVPAAGAGGPYVPSGTLIQVDPGGSATVAVGNVVKSPEGRPVTLANPRSLAWSPNAIIDSVATSTGGLGRFEIKAGKTLGPAAVVARVVDGSEKATDRPRWVSIPVQVGEPGPLMRCPTEPLVLPAGGDPLTLPITQLCHVWNADPAALAKQTYTAQWEPGAEVADVRISGGGTSTVALEAGAAVRATTGRLLVTADGTKSSAVLQISAESVAPPVVSPIRLDHVRGGQPVVVDVADYVSSQLRKPQIGITNLTARGNSDVAATVDGTRITFRPGDKAVGLAEFDLEVSDSAGAPDTRRARSLISLDVFGVPEPPTNVRASASAVNGTVDLSWSPGAANGSPIEHFVVEGGPHTQECVASPCTIKGLPTDKSVSFRVRAVNEAGASDLSAPSEPITVLVRPDAMNGVAIEASGDGWLDVSWRGPSSGGKVDSYYITWPSNHATPAASSTGMRISGLDNNQVTTVCVRAVNEAGDGPEICVDGQSAGPPDAPIWVGQSRGSGSVTLAWTAVPPNGPGTVVYHVRSEPSGRSCDTSATSCVVAMSNDGSTYTFYVRAETTVGQSAEVASAPYVDSGTPEPFISVSVEPTGRDNTVTATFQAGATNGVGGTVTGLVGDPSEENEQGSVTIPASGGSGTLTLTLSANGTPTEVVLKNCNVAFECAYSDAQTVESYGPLNGKPRIDYKVDGENVVFWISGEANGRDATLSVASSRGGSATTVKHVGAFSTDPVTVTVGYGNTVDLSGSITDGGPPISAESVSVTIGPAPRTPKVTVLSTPATGCPNELSPCQSISVELTDFSPSTPRCQVTYQDPIDTTPFEELFQAISSPYSLGLFDGNNVTIVCKDEIYGDITGSL